MEEAVRAAAGEAGWVLGAGREAEAGKATGAGREAAGRVGEAKAGEAKAEAAETAAAAGCMWHRGRRQHPYTHQD